MTRMIEIIAEVKVTLEGAFDYDDEEYKDGDNDIDDDDGGNKSYFGGCL